MLNASSTYSGRRMPIAPTARANATILKAIARSLFDRFCMAVLHGGAANQLITNLASASRALRRCPSQTFPKEHDDRASKRIYEEELMKKSCVRVTYSLYRPSKPQGGDMPRQRRDFIKQLFAAGTLPGLFAQPAALALLLDPQAVKEANPDYDAASHDFWSGFTGKTGRSAIVGTGQTRGAADGTQPVFLHHGPDGFKNAALLDHSKLVEEGDVVVSL